jgi:hypothetical protein
MVGDLNWFLLMEEWKGGEGWRSRREERDGGVEGRRGMEE